MNWPFVSRRAHEDATSRVERERDYWKSEHERAIGRAEELRTQREYLQARVEALTNDLLSMRRDGFDVRKPAKITQPVDAEAAAVATAEGMLVRGMKRGNSHFVKAATAKIMAERGVSEPVARAEAMKLRRAVTDEDPPV